MPVSCLPFSLEMAGVEPVTAFVSLYQVMIYVSEKLSENMPIDISTHFLIEQFSKKG